MLMEDGNQIVPFAGIFQDLFCGMVIIQHNHNRLLLRIKTPLVSKEFHDPALSQPEII